MLLAFNAGAVNAGGFLVLHAYTSHMTGFVSQIADGAVLGNGVLVAGACGAILSFTFGAAVCAFLVNWGRTRGLHSVYALPLVLEAAMLAIFGMVGATAVAGSAASSIPLIGLLLAFTMGLQNAVASKTSGGSIRTTHMTGNITDLGMELGKRAFWSSLPASVDARSTSRPDAQRLGTAAGLAGMFLAGALAGAAAFKHVGFSSVVPLAAVLLALSMPPLWRDVRSRRARRRRRALVAGTLD